MQTSSDSVQRIEGVEFATIAPTVRERPDSEILRAVRCVLDGTLKNSSPAISITVCGGDVLLTGNVPYCIEGQYAAQAAGNVAGVRRVINHIEIDAHHD